MNKVLCIIDDDPIYQFLINKIIRNSNIGHDVMFFKNGKEAIDYFKLDWDNNLPEIILLDLQMPIMDGWDFLKEINNLHTDNTDIYIVSSSISNEDKEKAKEFPKIKGHLSKPLNATKIGEITNPS
ncbi:MAG: response regulator [Flavobacterium sp.]